uniref:Uncharacterized protein n=1 Tax=Tetranychus urticae TaxID=32264 RepID=T1JQW3_TETUR
MCFNFHVHCDYELWLEKLIVLIGLLALYENLDKLKFPPKKGKPRNFPFNIPCKLIKPTIID